MNLKYVKEEIYNLGFSSPEDVEDSIVLQAINRAVDTIANTVRPIVRSHTIICTDIYETIFNFRDIAAINEEKFVAFEKIYENTEDGLLPTANARVINHYTLQAKPGGEYVVFYKIMPEVVTDKTPDEFEFELDFDLHVLIPLLAAFYVWQDDEERKADKLYNDYETKRNDIVARETKIATIAYVRSEADGD